MSTASPTNSRHDWFHALPPVLRGGLWMLCGTFFFGLMILLVRQASFNFSAVEITTWRALFGLLFMVPWLLRTRLRRLRTRRPGLHLWRNAVHFVGIVTWYYAVARINLSEGVALQFTVPLFTIALAMLFLKERVDAQRWIATLIGFSGVLVILRPGAIEISAVALITLLSAACYAVSLIFTKIVGREDPAELVVFYMNLMQLPMGVAAMLVFGWSVPGWWDLPLLAAVAATASLAHYFLARAFREADASQVIPIDFLKLPWVAGLAWLIFDEAPTVWGWLGGAVIFGATYYIVRREARIGRAAMAIRD